MIALVASVFFCCTPTYAAEAPIGNFSIDIFSNSLFADIAKKKDLKSMVDSYCTSVLNAPAFTKNGFVYNGKQSAFVHLFCKNAVGKSSDFFSPTLGASMPFLARTTFSKLNFETIVTDGAGQIDYCQPMNNDCDLSKNLSTLFNAIISDYVNMKQANIYGLRLNFWEEKDIEHQLNLFSSGYFDGLQVCAKDNRTYPKTCAMMKWYFKNARNLLSDVRVFNATWILEINSTFNFSGCETKDANYNILLCGLYDDPSNSFVSFVNLTYNELFFYRLFMWYYFVALQKNPNILIASTKNNNLDTLMKKFSTQYTRSKNALSLTFRMLRDTNIGFPFHVWLSLYQEDVSGFGKILVKIATPIYTLYDKLRNVQAPK